MKSSRNSGFVSTVDGESVEDFILIIERTIPPVGSQVPGSPRALFIRPVQNGIRHRRSRAVDRSFDDRLARVTQANLGRESVAE